MEQAVEIFAAVNFFVMGLSHILMPRTWTEFFVMLREKGAAGCFVNGFLNLGMGSLIVAFHNVWTGLATVLTVVGWLYVAKSLLIFAVPGYGVRSLSHISQKSAKGFVVAGVVLLILCGLLTYSLATASR